MAQLTEIAMVKGTAVRAITVKAAILAVSIPEISATRRVRVAIIPDKAVVKDKGKVAGRVKAAVDLEKTLYLKRNP
jgi:hypothetical protein